MNQNRILTGNAGDEKFLESKEHQLPLCASCLCSYDICNEASGALRSWH